MTNLQRRLKKLEALLTDDARLIPHSPQWLAYWTERIDRLLSEEDSEPDVGGIRIPLEALDAIMAVDAIARRLLKLENRYVPRKSDELTIAERIRERRRLRCEREGRPFICMPPKVRSSIPPGLTMAARMRCHRDYRRAAKQALSGPE